MKVAASLLLRGQPLPCTIRHPPLDMPEANRLAFRSQDRSKRLRAWCSPANSSDNTPGEPTTLYQLLGVPEGATPATLKTAFRKLVQRYHPDVRRSQQSSQSGRQFQAVTQAYEVLRDEQLRLRYDLYGLAGISSQYQVLKEVLSDNVRPAAGPDRERGRDAHLVVGLDFSEAVTGVEKVVQLDVQGPCSTCKGSGGVSDTGQVASSCHVCNGSREVLRSVWQPTGVKVMHVGVCPACGGTGTQAQLTCHSCDGEGRVQVRRRVHVKIPGGVDATSLMRLPGHGHAGRRGGPPGDLMIRFNVHDEPDIQRQGRHLYSDLTCDVWQVMLGCSLPVKSIRGERFLSVPAGSQHGDVIQMTAAGVAEVGPQGVEYGHHYFKLKVRLPHGDLMDPGARTLLQQLQQHHLGHGSYGHHDHADWRQSLGRNLEGTDPLHSSSEGHQGAGGDQGNDRSQGPSKRGRPPRLRSSERLE